MLNHGISKDTLRVAVIGLGYWGDQLAEAATRSPSMHLEVVASNRPERAAELAGKYGCKSAAGLEEALSIPEVEAVILTTANPDHAQGIMKAAASGRHVFVEKPITNTLDEAHEAVQAAKKAGVVLAVGHQFRRTGAARALKGAIEDGGVGMPILASANFSLPGRIRPDSWKSSQDGCPGGVLIQLGIHHIDTLTHLLGPARVAGALLVETTPEFSIPTVAAVTLTHESGVTSTVISSYRSPWYYDIHIFGDQGSLHYQVDLGPAVSSSRMDERTRLYLHRGEDVAVLPFDVVDPVAEEIEDFAAATRGASKPEVGPADAVAALDLVWQAIRLSREKTGGI
jgi:predicted dehydrogenase